jgi:hypothetical protein
MVIVELGENENTDSSNEKYYKFYYPFELGEDEQSISQIFSSDFIIIKNTEELSEKQQMILTKALSTKKDGEVGLGDHKGLKRIVFISSFGVNQLTEGQGRLIPRFWDRISQLVIDVPSFSDDSTNILSEFKSVWNKMEFQEYSRCPEDGEFQYWLRETCKKFAGNFRDLDKLAILWHQYRIMEYNSSNQKFKSDLEVRIFRKVREDFDNLTHYPTEKADTSNIFEIQKGKTWEQIERGFHAKFKAWAKENYGSIKEATQDLNMPLRKMDKW